jgi:hypothetical protein
MRRLTWLVAALALAVLISACGSSKTSTSRISDGTQNGVQFSECMRHNGVSNFPDPNGSGKLTIDAVANGSSVDTNAPAFKQALGACKHLEPAGFTGSKRSTRLQQAALRFAQCIRDHGVKDFPDPLPDGPLVDTNRIPSTAQPGGMGMLHTAMQSCSDAAAAAGVTR